MQNINIPGLLITPYVGIFRRDLAIPHFRFDNIAALDPEILLAAGVEGVFFDKDETLTEKYHPLLHPKIHDAFGEYQRVFGDKLAVISNKIGTRDDKDHLEAERFEKDYSIRVVRHRWKKPGRIDLSDITTDPTKWLVIGDSVLTDIMFGNGAGTLTALTKRLSQSPDDSAIGRTRDFERKALDYFVRKGYTAPPHKLYSKVSKALGYFG